ncbi:MAG: class I SAM-dependent methyltransferase [Promethearchaeota archaeon]
MKGNLRTKLIPVIPLDLHYYIPSSFDILGSKEKSVAIIEIPNELVQFENEIAKAIIELHKNVKSVLSKKTGRYGDFRNRDFSLIYGDEDTEVIHKESGCRFKLDPRKSYFSQRESTERERIASQITSFENILVMFSGVGPFPICIAKKHPKTKITAIEMNPDAHQYCVENIKLNKVIKQVTPILGDVREVCPSLDETFDRILMPLPKGAFQFLSLAFPLLVSEGVLHFYHWSNEENLFDEAENIVRSIANEFSRRIEVINRVRVSKYSPGTSKIRIDVKIL